MDIISIQNSIAERDRIIYEFNRSGFLNRDDAIRKIIELRGTDQEVLAVTTGNMVIGGSTPFSECSDAQLVDELEMQADILRAKLIKEIGEKS